MKSPLINLQLKQGEKRNKTGYKILLLDAVHFSSILFVFVVSWRIFKYGAIVGEYDAAYRYNIYVAILYSVLLLFFMNTYNGYLLGYISIRRLVFYQFLSQFLSLLMVYIIVTLAWARFKNPLLFLMTLAIQLMIDVLWSILADSYYVKKHGTRSTVLVYGNDLYKKFFNVLEGKPSENMYRVDREIQYNGDNFDDIRDRLKGYQAIFSVGIHLHCRNEMMKYCKEENIPFFFMPTIGDVIIKESGHLKSFDAPVFFVSRSRIGTGYAVVKRTLDIICSALGLIILSPILLITALAIHLYDGGPAFYKQDRLTKDGKVFQIYKFRSMRVDAEADGVARLSAGDNDDRVTPIGRVVRKIRFDELPQLWNIFKGDMTIVGPRPERPELAEQYYEYLPEFRLRLQAKAGLTGYAQVYGRYNTDPYEKLVFDLLYINHMDFKIDIMLMFATIAILFSSNSTMGVELEHKNLEPEEYREYDIIHEDI